MPLLFSPEINWLTPFTEELEYETTIVSGYSEYDQRTSLLDVPNRRFTYSISALDAREAGLLEALIRSVQHEPCYVPYWRGARRMNSLVLVPGFANEVYCDTAFAGFEADNWIMLFVDAHQVGIAKIVGVFADHILTDVVITGSWPIGRTKAVPVFLGQLAPSVDLDYAAKSAKIAQVVFDIHPVKRQLSTDCNFGDFNPYPFAFPPDTTWVLEPAAGPTGGPAFKVTIPANSRIGGSVFAICRFIRLLGLIPGASYSMECKVKTSWDVSDPALGSFDGVPGIALAASEIPSVGTNYEAVTPAAHNAWEQLTTSEVVNGAGWLIPQLCVSEGTISDDPLFAWFADLVIRDSEDNIIHSCLPAMEDVDLLATPIFAPLASLHRPGQSLQKVQRAVTQLSSPAGAFSVRSRSDDPYPEHPLELVFFKVEEVYDFLTFLDVIKGAFMAFWIPSYQQDLTPIGTIGPADVTFLIEHCRYTELLFPGLMRRQIAFVQPDGSFKKRSIEAAVDNGNGTESLTINEALGASFTQNPANGICFLWYGRLSDDVVRLPWMDTDRTTLDLTMVEISDPPNGGSGDSSDGFLSDVP